MSLALMFQMEGTEEERIERWNRFVAEHFPGEQPWIPGEIFYDEDYDRNDIKDRTEKAIDRQRNQIRDDLKARGIVQETEPPVKGSTWQR